MGDHTACPRCARTGGLVYMGKWVERNSHWLGVGGIECRLTPVPLGLCEFCGHRVRVLPIEIAPFKSYTRPVIETACGAYTDPEVATLSLRQTVARLGKGHPHRSALHGWLGGLGARALGRLDRGTGRLPAGTLLAESASGLRAECLSWWAHPWEIAVTKYRSPRRREQLQACRGLFATAQRLFPRQAQAWCAWETWLQTRFHVAAWTFPSRFRGTAIQQHGPRRSTVECAPLSREPKSRTKGNVYGARAPP